MRPLPSQSRPALHASLLRSSLRRLGRGFGPGLARALPWGLAASLTAACSRGPSPDAAREPMNLLFVSIDTLRADHVGCYGYPRPTTPEIDALAADGHRFEAAYTVMATTLPAHLSMFTSLFPAQTGVIANGFKVPPGVDTLAERLGQAGFHTGGFVSSFPLDRQFLLDQGFDVYDSPGKQAREGADTVALAKTWLESLGRERPFFCFVHLYDPHTWYQVDEPVFAEPFGAVPGQRFPPDRGFLEQPIAEPERKASRDAYDAEIRYADAQVRDLLDFLDRRDLRENTIVVVVSDHGETLDEMHASDTYAFDHGEFLSRRELHIPLILWLPHGYAERGPAVHPDLVSVLDLMPTLLDLLGEACGGPVVGRSLTGLMRGEPLEGRLHFSQRRTLERSDRTHIEGREHSVIDGRWHWVSSRAREDELFDLHSDPTEQHNVLQQHPKRAQALRAALVEWHERVARQLWDSDGNVSDEASAILESLGYVGGTE